MAGVCLAVLAGCSDLGDPLTPACEVSATALDFGQVAVNDSVELVLVIRSTGSAPLSGNATLSCPAFTLISGGGRFVIAPGQSRSLVVRFLPTTAGLYTCTLDPGTGCRPVLLAGVAQDPTSGALCEVAPASLDFGSIVAGTTRAQDFVIRSIGTADLEADVALPCPEFAIETNGGPHTIAPGDSLVVRVRFQPTLAGNFNCPLDLGITCSDLTVSGTATAAPTVSFAGDIQPIFNNRGCVSCHSGPAAAGGMDLSPGPSYGMLVNHVSGGYAPAIRVVPLDTANSVLYGKLANTGQFGGGMPPGSSIPPAELAKVRAWILAGAPNN
jgi:cytochrome c551/c552